MPRDAETRNADEPEPARDPAGAILDALAEALAPHALNAPIIAAVSGGSDSTALLLALAEMRNVDPDTRAREVLVVTIDHDLRADSADDAVFVERLAARHGLTAETCVWRGDKPVAGLQAEARKARYAFLISEAERRWPGRQVLVLTAHTEDDQAETVLMRLARGSGPAGLAAMTPWRRLKSDSDVRLLRPFLTRTRDDLRAFVASKGETWRDDPSNENDAFERIRWRKLHATLSEAGLSSRALGTTARRMARAEAALQSATKDAFTRIRFDGHGGGFATVDAAPFARLPDELAVRVLAHMLGAFGGSARAAELASIEALHVSLAQSITAFTAHRASLGGCLVATELTDDGVVTLSVFREPGRFPSQEVSLPTTGPLIWDARLSLTHSGDWPDGSLIRPLGSSRPADSCLHVADAAAPDCHLQAWPAIARATWPAVFAANGDLLAIAAPALLARCAPRETRGSPVISAQWLHSGQFQGPDDPGE